MTVMLCWPTFERAARVKDPIVPAAPTMAMLRPFVLDIFSELRRCYADCASEELLNQEAGDDDDVFWIYH